MYYVGFFSLRTGQVLGVAPSHCWLSWLLSQALLFRAWIVWLKTVLGQEQSSDMPSPTYTVLLFFPAARPEECVAEWRLRTSIAAVIYVLLVVRSAVHRHQGTSSCQFLRLQALCVRFGRHWRQALMDPVADGCHTASQSSSSSPASRLPRTLPLQPASAIATSSCCKAGTPLSAISPHSHVAPCALWPPSWRRVLRSWAAELTQSVSSFVRNSLGNPFLCKLPLCSPSLSCPALAVLLSVAPLSEERISC